MTVKSRYVDPSIWIYKEFPILTVSQNARIRAPEPGSRPTRARVKRPRKAIETPTTMPAEARTIRIRAQQGVELSCLHWESDSGLPERDSTPVVLLHGGGANAHWWDHLAARLVRRRPIYALDFRGHGDSDRPEERRVGAFNLDLEALVEALGREDIFLVGHSLGASVALDHASRFAATRGIALIDLALGSSHRNRRRARLALSLRRTYASREEAISRFRFLPESSHPTEALRQHIAERSVQEEPDGRYGYKFDPRWFGLPTRPRPELDRVHCPTLLVRGCESGLLSREAALSFVEALPDARLVEIEGAGHHVLVDQPERLFEALDAFLDTQSQVS